MHPERAVEADGVGCGIDRAPVRQESPQRHRDTELATRRSPQRGEARSETRGNASTDLATRLVFPRVSGHGRRPATPADAARWSPAACARLSVPPCLSGVKAVAF